MVAREYGLPESSLIVEHTGSSFAVHRDYGPSSGDGRRLLAMYVGTFAPGRGLETMFALAERHTGVDFCLVGGQEYPGELPSNVSLQPAVSHADVPELLSRADILLMPYTRGTMLPDGHGGTAEYCSPLKMFEYLSAGRSIIASDLPSIAEVLVDGSNCLLVDPDSIEQWSAALSRLESDPRLRETCAQSAAGTAEDHAMVDRVKRIVGEAGGEL
jgi:glycosyltransferase involved in cell wall biosynthesis